MLRASRMHRALHGFSNRFARGEPIMSVRIASLVGAVLFLASVLPAHAAATAEMFFGATVKFAEGPVSGLLGIGAGFMDELIHSDVCLSGGERTAESAARSAALPLLGAVTGAVAGAAIGGDMGSVAKGGVAGLAIGGLAGAAGGNRALGAAVADSRDRERRQMIDLCHIAGTARDLAKPVWADFARVAAPVCGVDPARIFTGDNAANDYVVNRCARANADLTASLREHLIVIRSINYSACRTGLYVVTEYDRQRREEALRTGGSAMPTPKVDCTGSSLANQWSWLLK
jgi:hypothetical protein